MPLYDFLCDECYSVTEKLVPSSVSSIVCPECLEDAKHQPRLSIGCAVRQLSAPARITMADMPTLNRKRQRVKEPLWRYPDGHAESVH